MGMENLAIASYPGVILTDSKEELSRKVKEVLMENLVKGLGETVAGSTDAENEPGPRDIVFEGTYEEVNELFLEKSWTDGLPIAPPTPEKVAEFLKFTNRDPDEVIAVLMPDKREATPWNIAVNGIISGCRPEYMPVLIAIVEAMADPKFAQENLGQTPGTEILITLNGPIIKELDFNYTQGALRVGFQANTSIGRFWRMYLRNVAGLLPHKSDKATFGGTFRVVLAENEDAVADIGWEPMSVDQGFQAGDNVVTITSCTSTDSFFTAGAPTALEILKKLAARTVDIQLYLVTLELWGEGVCPQLLISPAIAEVIAKDGYSKQQVKQYLFEHTFFPARRLDQYFPFMEYKSLCDAVAKGKMPRTYCESEDPERLVPLVRRPEDFLITVSGDPGRDNCLLCAQNGFIGYPTSRKIGLPDNWKELLAGVRKK
jgi:hypothetical protein